MMNSTVSRGRKNGKGIYFVSAGVLFTLLLVIFVASTMVGPRAEPDSLLTVGPSIEKLLPDSARFDDGSLAEVPSLGEGLRYVVGYENEGETELALLEWEASRNRYVVRHSLVLQGDAGKLVGVPGLALMPLGDGGSHIVLVHSKAVGNGEVVILIAADEGGLRVIRVYDGSGEYQPAEFSAGNFGENRDVRLQDLDNNGVRELLVGDKEAEDGMEVFTWKDGVFVFDESLSWAMALSKSLFPEPAEAATVE